MKFTKPKRVGVDLVPDISLKKRMRGSRGPTPTVSAKGATRFIMWLPNPLRRRVDTFNKDGKKLGLKRLPYATVLRDGGGMYMKERERELEQAKQGKLHAKRRTN
jgi:hypothetical protein